MVRSKQISPIFMSSPESSVEWFSARSQSSSEGQSLTQATTQTITQTITQSISQNLSLDSNQNSFQNLSQNSSLSSTQTPQKSEQRCLARKSTTSRKQLEMFSFKNKKSYRRKRRTPGTIALRDIRRYQNSAQLLIPSISFQRLVRQICQEMSDKEFRFQPLALLALQESSEIYITTLLEDSNLCAIHTGRVTILPRDMLLALRLRKLSNK